MFFILTTSWLTSTNLRDFTTQDMSGNPKGFPLLFYPLVAKVGTVKDGDYVIVVMRNDHAREEFKLKYDSSRAN